MTNKTILVITDGIGHNDNSQYNAFAQATTPTYDYLFKEVPNSLIHTYGEHVGLPRGQMGNSEVGHMTIGSGRVLYQDLVKINMAIEKNTLKDNLILKQTIEKSKTVHLFALLSDGGVHSHINHLIQLALICKNENKDVKLHLITDGRDVSPKSSKKYVKQILDICDEDIKIASIAGRYYSMDRDNRWDRIQKAYDAHVNAKNISNGKDILEYIEASYENNIYDEFIEPTSFDNYKAFKNNDAVVFCNFRSDRMRELSEALANKNFKHFSNFKDTLHICTMTQYNKNLPLPIMFPKDTPINTLAEVISNAGLTQVHTSETEKYAHVTFFFNGGVEEPLLNEKRVLIPSPDVATYDLKPEMSAPAVCDAVITAMEEKNDFIVVNFANGDMVGHTGSIEAAIKAVEVVDAQLEKIIKKTDELNYNLIITSDHGNCEEMKDANGDILTNHTVGEVYCFIKAPNIKEVKNGSLNNIAPSVLKLMNLEIPVEMDEALI